MFAIIWIPAFAGMTAWESGNGGGEKREWRGREAGMAGWKIRNNGATVASDGRYSPIIMRTLHKTEFAPGIHWPVSTWLIG